MRSLQSDFLPFLSQEMQEFHYPKSSDCQSYEYFIYFHCIFMYLLVVQNITSHVHKSLQNIYVLYLSITWFVGVIFAPRCDLFMLVHTALVHLL